MKFKVNTTLHARWVDGPVYEIGLNDMDGTAVSRFVYEVPGTDVYNDSDLENAMSKTENEVATPSRDHYTFEGYWLRIGGSGNAMGNTLLIDKNGFRTDAFTNTYFNSDRSIYAHWTPDVYEVTLDNRGADTGSEGAGSVYERYGDGIYHEGGALNRVNAGNPIDTPSKAGKVFKGYWTTEGGPDDPGGKCYIDENGAVMGDFSSTAFGDGTGVLYAYWADPEIYEIKLMMNDGTGDKAGSVYEAPGDGIFLDAACADPMAGANGVTPPSRAHYTFAGYNARVDGSGDTLIDKNGYRDEALFADDYFSGDGKLYAQWEPDVYPVTLEDQDADTPGPGFVYEKYATGIFHDPAATDRFRDANPIAQPDLPTKAGKVFGGYWTKPGGPEDPDAKLFIDSKGKVTGDFSSTAFEDDKGVLYAYWEEPPVLLPFTGGMGDNAPLLWGVAVAVVAAAGVLMFRSLRRPAHGSASRSGRTVAGIGARRQGAATGSRRPEPAKAASHASATPAPARTWLPSTISRR